VRVFECVWCIHLGDGEVATCNGIGNSECTTHCFCTYARVDTGVQAAHLAKKLSCLTVSNHKRERETVCII